MSNKQNSQRFRRFVILSVVSFFLLIGRQAFAAVQLPDNLRGATPLACGEIVTTGTYTLSGNVSTSTGPCFTITSGGSASLTVIGGAGQYTVTGDILGDGVGTGGPGHNFTLQNVTVTGNTTSNGGSVSTGSTVGGAGGNIVIANSTTTSVTSSGGNSTSASSLSSGGTGGSVSIANSTTTAITANGGNSSHGAGGTGGGLVISDSMTTVIMSNGGTGNKFNASGGAGGTVTVTYSTVSSLTSNGGINGYSTGSGGSGGAVSIATSTVGSVTSNGANSYTAGSGGNINATSSMITSISSNGGTGTNGGSGGAVVINSSHLNINNLSVSSTGGSGTNGTLTFNYATIQYSGLTLSALSNVVFNDQNNLPGSMGSFAGGSYPVLAMATLSPGTINTCGRIYSGGTYTLGSSLNMSGACVTIFSAGVTIDGGNNGSGGHYAITGDVNGNATSTGSSGFDFTLRNLDVFGTTTSNGAGDGGSCSTGGGNGGNITMTNASSTVVTANAGNLVAFGCDSSSVSGGNGGSITFSGTNVDLSSKTMSVRGGYNDGNATADGVITVNYADTLNILGMRISALSNLILNSPLNTPGSLGASDGGIIGTLPGGTVSNSSQCNLALAGTYTLGSTISGDCNITANGVVINGTGHVITGQVNGSSLNPFLYSYTNGHNFTLENVTVDSAVTSAGLFSGPTADNNGCKIGDYGLSGGNITITDSTTTSVIANGSSPSHYLVYTCGDYGQSGLVDLADSKFTSVSSKGGSSSSDVINISGNTLDLSSVSIDTVYDYFSSGKLSINYGKLITDGSTFFHTLDLVVNGFSLGAWNGMYNPSGLYFNDQASGAGNDGNWSNPLNWWNDIAFTIPSGAVPTGLSKYVVNDSSVTDNTGNSPVTADTVTFNNGSINAIDINANKVIFNDTSRNMGTITGGQAIFNGNQSENDATASLFVLNQRRSDPSGDWTSIISSADGTELAAINQGDGHIYTSSNSGATWIVSSAPGANWTSITSSADGTKLAATAAVGQIYVSTNSGATWTPHGPSKNWLSITSSSDGTKLAVVAQAYYDEGTGQNVDTQIYTSSDSGATWTPHGPAQYWRAITSSSDGIKLAAITYADQRYGYNQNAGQVFTSSDSGATWTVSSAPGANWTSITSSADGTELLASAIGTPSIPLYISTDSGVTWATSSAPAVSWKSVALSADGTKIAALANVNGNGLVYVSTDSGATWTPHGPSKNWLSITSSSDGTKLAATAYPGQIYTMANTPTSVHRSGTIASSTPIRQYTTDTVVGTRDFTNTGTNWIVQAAGVAVNLSSSVYNTSADTFQQLLGGSFTTNSSINGGAAVVPQVSITSPANSVSPSVVKWLPSVDWDTSTLCQYSYDDFATMHTVDCSKNGTDIGKPSAAGSQTLYVEGTDSRGDLTQKSATFTYDNTSPVYTSCGGDLLDESTRQYYYLNGNVTGNCVATANVTLEGTSTQGVVGYTVNGNIIATSNGNGYNVSLKDVIVTGSVNASGADNGSGTGYNGGNITIDPSITGNVISNGGNSPTKGGNGGIISITDSGGIASSTTVSANGGDATSCGYGGNGGSVTLTASAYGAISNSSGKNMTATFANGGYCPNTLSVNYGSSGSSGSRQIIGQYTPPVLAQAPVPLPEVPVVPVAQPSPVQSLSGSFSNITNLVSNTASTSIAAITENVRNNIVTLESLVPVAVKAVVNTANTVVNSQTSKAVQTTGFFAGLVASVAMYTDTGLATPWAASEIFLIPVKLWGLILVGLGIRKKTRPWGTVYDSVTKQPIDPAFVTARDANGKVVAEAITDIDGRYGFLLPDGTYYISAKKTNYEFPSKKMIGKSSDELYNNLYFGEPVTIRGGEVLDKNIPLDQKNFDWNEYAKRERHATLFHSKHEKAVAVAGNYIYGIGLAISVIAVMLKRSPYNISVLVIYVLVLAFMKFGMKKKKLGHIMDKATNEPVPYAIIRVTTLDHQVTLRSGVCDADGRYYCIVPKGDYYVDIEKKNPDGSYAKIYESPQISSSSGIINKDFEV